MRKNREKYLAGKKRWYLKHRAKILAYQEKYRSEHKEKISTRAKVYREGDKRDILLQKKKEDYQKNKERYRARNAAWRSKNPEWQRDNYAKNRDSINAKRRPKVAAKMKSDPHARAAASMRSRVWELLKKAGAKKIASVGLEAGKLKLHLEGKFKEGMTWANCGSEWHVDHIKPCASFDLTSPEQLLICFAYENLQPLWALENIKKGCKT